MKKNKKFVVLIGLTKNCSWPKVPQFGDYSSPQILSVTPCTVSNGRYISWETGKEVKKSENALEWGLQVGTMFRLKNKKQMLITRNTKGEAFLISQKVFNPTSMVRYEAK